MTIVVTGGGSGGHITPILAVASELKRIRPDAHVVYIGQRGDKLTDIPKSHPDIDEVFAVSAGKFRRYAGEGAKQLLDIKTQRLNIRDGFRTLAGIWQSYRLMRQLQPTVIFSRGGFVSVPVALGGKLRGVPYITHDSDILPSLANRMIARWAAVHAVALPKELYPYPASKTVNVGIPLSRQYELVTPELKRRYRHELHIPAEAQVLFITGGGNGARQLNQVILDNAAALLKHHPQLIILHVSGRELEQSVSDAYNKLLRGEERGRVRVEGFVSDQYRYSGAADIVIARGGATTLAEFAIQGAVCIIIPSKQLIWNVKNSEALAKRGAVIELSEDASEQELRLAHVVSGLLQDSAKRDHLARIMHSLAHTDAAKDTAELIIKTAKSAGKGS
jgi:UDP-N-acetylglucosamine--N-acetylmuramyl-(pentapeptide) pyrophosphoryl-undecaprenol N-acetylglucosamine transferase